MHHSHGVPFRSYPYRYTHEYGFGASCHNSTWPDGAIISPDPSADRAMDECAGNGDNCDDNNKSGNNNNNNNDDDDDYFEALVMDAKYNRPFFQPAGSCVLSDERIGRIDERIDCSNLDDLDGLLMQLNETDESISGTPDLNEPPYYNNPRDGPLLPNEEAKSVYNADLIPPAAGTTWAMSGYSPC